MKIEQGTVLTDGKKYWLYGADNKAHPIEVSTNPEHFDVSIWEEEPTYVIRNRIEPITKDMKPITDIVELTPSVKLIPESKAVIAHSVFRQGYYDLEDLQLHYDIQKPYVIDLTYTVSTMVKPYGFTGVTQYSALHDRPASDDGCWDYDYATVSLYGVVRFVKSCIIYSASSMRLIDKLDYRSVLKEAVGNLGVCNTDCKWITGNHNVSCSYSHVISNCVNTVFSSLSKRLKDCVEVSSSKLCAGCSQSSCLTGCLNVNYCKHCLCCFNLDSAAPHALFNKQVSIEEYSSWDFYIRKSKAETWADLYKALSYKKVGHLLGRTKSTITAKDVSAFRKRIKAYC